MLCWFLVVAAVTVLSQGAAHGQGSCLTIVPPSPSFVPPKPYWQNSTVGTFWYGTDALSTSLPVDGKWGGLHNDQGFRPKLFFWAKGYDWRKEGAPELIFTGHRLDGEAPDVAVAHANSAFVTNKDAAGMVTAFELPTVGCWQLTAHYHGHALVFVALVDSQWPGCPLLDALS